MKAFLTLALCSTLYFQPVLAQQANVNLDWQAQKNTEGLKPYGAPLNSPEVHDDRTVTFRIKAPAATSVDLSGGTMLTALNQGGKPVPFIRGDDGIWSLTVGPLRTDIYAYQFIVDGAQITDPSNTVAAFGNAPPFSEAVIYGDGPAYYDAKNVPHGLITRHLYHSNVTNGEREMFVYTPPDYDPRQSYPVLYLLEGSSGVASSWMNVGRINLIMDNLLAEGKAKPMIIAMPNNQMLHRSDPQHAELTFDLFERELREHIIPLADSKYSTRPNPHNRAISGLSMGGRQAMFIGLGSPDLFGSVGVLSAGDEESETVLADFLNNPEANNNVDYLFVGQGTEEEKQPFLNERVADFVAALNAHGIKHEYYAGGYAAHEWPTWRHLVYYRFLPNLWREQ